MGVFGARARSTDTPMTANKFFITITLLYT